MYHKSALLDASNAHIAQLEMKLNTANACLQNEKRDFEFAKEQLNKQLSEAKEEYKILKEMLFQYEENKEEAESKKEFLEKLPEFGPDVIIVDSNTVVCDQDAKFRLGMMLADIDDSGDNIPNSTTTSK